MDTANANITGIILVAESTYNPKAPAMPNVTSNPPNVPINGATTPRTERHNQHDNDGNKYGKLCQSSHFRTNEHYLLLADIRHAGCFRMK